MNLLVENQTVKTLCQSIVGVKPAVVSRQPRTANIERLRFVSAFGVASFHTQDWFSRSIVVAGFIVYFVMDNIYSKENAVETVCLMSTG